LQFSTYYLNALATGITSERRVLVSWMLLALCLAPATAKAQYLDPGAASIVIQAIVAGVVAVGAGVKLYWSRISGLFSRRRRPEQEE
jgi:hypothetical protein